MLDCTNSCIIHYRIVIVNDRTEQQDHKIWMFIGKNRSHFDTITGLIFGKRDGDLTLFSISRDRYLLEYDLEGASISNGFHLLNPRKKIEQTAHPTCCFWSDDFADGREPILVIGNDEYKFKLWNTDSKTCRKTVLAPTYGGYINDIFLLPQAITNKDIDCIVYGTDEKVIGMVMLPFDGNPLKSIGFIAHPGDVSHIQCSYDGKYIFSAGGSDGTVNMWSVDLIALKRSSEPLNHRSNPYAALLEGGYNGEFYHEMLDYFYFSQLRAQGEDTTEGRSLGGRVK